MRRSVATLALLVLMCARSWAHFVLDDFNRSDGALGANWTDIVGAMAVVSNQAVVGAGDEFESAAYTGVTLPANQYCEVTVKQVADNSAYLAVTARMSTDGQEMYLMQTDGSADVGDASVYKVVDGVGSKLFDHGATFSANDIGGIATVTLASGSVKVTAYKNRVATASGIDASSPITSGHCGMNNYSGGATAVQADDFRAYSVLCATDGTSGGFRLGC